ncbi:hypothetical protein RCH06_001671 [Polaromonas sp. CG_9.5]|nr:hypothetical protein [Polaromonas sp. CG_9.5]
MNVIAVLDTRALTRIDTQAQAAPFKDTHCKTQTLKALAGQKL